MKILFALITYLIAFFITGAALLPAATSHNTYYGEARPILDRNCVTCRQSGQVAPFLLDTFEDAARRSKMIAAVTSSGRMPISVPVAAAGPDQFVCVVIPIPLEGERWVRRVELQAGNPRVVQQSQPPAAAREVGRADDQ